MRFALAAAALLLTGFAPAPSGPLAVEPSFFADEACLAPDFDGAGCPSAAPGQDDALTASAALLAPDLPEPAPRLAVDSSVFREGSGLTY